MGLKTRIGFGIMAVAIVIAGVFGVWQYLQAQKVAALAQINAAKLMEQAGRDSAMQAFRIQYSQVMDKITVQGVETSKAEIIYWTENTTQPGRVILHASALISGVFVELPHTRDVTDLTQGK